MEEVNNEEVIFKGFKGNSCLERGYFYMPYITIITHCNLHDQTGNYSTNQKTKKTTVTRSPKQKCCMFVLRLFKKNKKDLYKKKINPKYYTTFKLLNNIPNV